MVDLTEVERRARDDGQTKMTGMDRREVGHWICQILPHSSSAFRTPRNQVFAKPVASHSCFPTMAIGIQ